MVICFCQRFTIYATTIFCLFFSPHSRILSVYLGIVLSRLASCDGDDLHAELNRREVTIRDPNGDLHLRFSSFFWWSSVHSPLSCPSVHCIHKSSHFFISLSLLLLYQWYVFLIVIFFSAKYLILWSCLSSLPPLTKHNARRRLVNIWSLQRMEIKKDTYLFSVLYKIGF